MTLRELYSIPYLEKEIEDYHKKILELRELAEKVTPSLTGMPSGGGAGDRVGDCATAIVMYTDLLEKAIARKIEQEMIINQYILDVEDTELRRIMYLRFVQQKTWREVADEIGGYSTEDSVRKRCNRYVSKNRANMSDMSASKIV